MGAYPHGGVAVGHFDVDVASTDALLIRDHAEAVGDLLVTRGVGDGEFVRDGWWKADREQPGAALLGSFGGGAPQVGDGGQQFVAVA